MASIKIVTDSTCDIPQEYLSKLDITVVPQYVIINNETFKDGVTIDYATFLQKLTTMRELPKTSQVTPGDFTETYDRLGQGGHEIVSIHVTSKLSGTWQSAMLAHEQVKERGIKVNVFDSLGGTSAMGWQVIEAARMAAAGESSTHILAHLAHMRAHQKLWVALETLEYAVKGGRVPKLQGLLASALNIKPIVLLHDGRLEPGDRIRTRSKQIDRVVDLAVQHFGQKPCRIGVTHAAVPDEAQALLERLKSKLSIRESYVHTLGVALTAHFGPGALGLAGYPI